MHLGCAGCGYIHIKNSSGIFLHIDLLFPEQMNVAGLPILLGVIKSRSMSTVKCREETNLLIDITDLHYIRKEYLTGDVNLLLIVLREVP